MNLLNDIKSRLISESAFGVSLHFIDDDTFHINALRLTKSQDKIEISGSWTDLPSTESLFKILNSKSPVWLSVSGKGILTRKVPYSEGENLLGKILPNARQEDFLIQTAETGIANEIFVSIARKEIIEKILDQFHNHSLFVTAVSLDCLSLEVLPENNLIKNGSIHTPFSRMEIKDSKISEIISESDRGEPLMIGNDMVPSELIIPFADAFARLLDTGNYQLQDEELPLRNEDYLYKRRIKYISTGALTGFLLLLLINFFFYSSYNSKKSRLEEQLVKNEQTIVHLEKLKEEYSVKNTLFEKSGIDKETRYSYYADRLASVLPDGIYLNQMALDPIAKKIKEDEPVEMKKNIIFITGTSSSSNILNNWIHKIRNFSWVEDLEILNYESETSMQQADFELEIKVMK